MSDMNVLVLRVNGRIENAPHLQEVLTKYGANIKARIGLHDEACASGDGLLILQLCGGKEEIKAVVDAVETAKGVAAKLVTI